MTHKFITKIIGIYFLLSSVVVNFLYGEYPPAPPTGIQPGFGGGVVGPGKPASPIDMYQIILLIIALVFISYFYKRYIWKNE